MLKLIESGLFGQGLISVNTPSMVKRYNDCLLDIGLEPTKLQSFHIDGWGWSPEIAEEQGNKFYHSHGFANPYSIIISPDQASSSLYFPFHSFDWNIHKEVFSKYSSQIADITTQCGMWFGLDQKITAYRAPQDLLLMENLLLHFRSVDGLMEAARKQRDLVSQFYTEGDAWADVELRDQIIESSKKYGDLRFRKLEIPDFHYNKINSFYSSTFNGLFVLKETPVSKPVLILENNTSAVSGQMQHAHIEFNINDGRLMSFLYGQKLIIDDLQYHRSHPELLEHQMEMLLCKAHVQLDETKTLTGLTDSKKKGLANALLNKGMLDSNYFELESLRRSLDTDEKLSLPSETGLRNHLLHPNPDLDEETKSVLWQLLSKLLGLNEVIFYTFDKVSFYNTYRQWKPAYQEWVIAEILKNKGIFNRLMN
jgi:hypothetical protein